MNPQLIVQGLALGALLLVPSPGTAPPSPKQAMVDALAGDPRNAGLKMSAYWESFLSSKVIIVSFDGMSEPKSQADILRVLHQFASRISGENRFKIVKLARSGKERFFIEGDYFRHIGREYEEGQNPVYLMRTLPENIYELDGRRAFGSWSGGLLGVVNRQMEDLNTFMRRWIEERPIS